MKQSQNKCNFNFIKLKSWAVPSYQGMMHISAWCVECDLHMTVPWLLQRTGWRQFAVQWMDCKKSQILAFSVITIIIITDAYTTAGTPNPRQTPTIGQDQKVWKLCGVYWKVPYSFHLNYRTDSQSRRVGMPTPSLTHKDEQASGVAQSGWFAFD